MIVTPVAVTSLPNMSCELQYTTALSQAAIRNFTSAEVADFKEKCDYNATDSGSTVQLGINEYIRIPMYIVIFIICVVGNTLVVVTLLQNRRMRTVTNIFLINLSVGDLLLGVFCMPFTLTGQILKRFIFGAIMCKMIPYFQVVSVAVSTFTLCSISIERFFAICCPLTSRRWQTVSHSIKVTIICWLLAFIVAFPVLYFSELSKYGTFDGVDYHMCREEFPWKELKIAYNLILFIILFGLPAIFMTLAYSVITINLYAGIKGAVSANTANGSMAYSPNDRTTGSLAKLSNMLARFRNGSNEHQSVCDFRNGSAAGFSPNAMAEDTDAPTIMSPAESSYTKSPSPIQGVRSTHTERNLQAKKKVILMLIVVVLEFFICFTPIWLVNIIGFFDAEGITMHVGGLGISYLQLLMYFSTCCNPITYCFLHSKFRQGMIQAFTCKKNKPDINDIFRTRTTKVTSYRNKESISVKSLNNVSMPLSKSTSHKSFAAIRPESIPPAIEEEDIEKSDFKVQSSQITWL